MAIDFLIKSRHGTVYYFRRRVPKQAQTAIGSPFLVRSLETSERRLAVIRARSLAAQTDIIFRRIFMAKRPSPPNGLSINYKFGLDIPRLGNLTIDAKPEEQDAVNSAIRPAIEGEIVIGNSMLTQHVIFPSEGCAIPPDWPLQKLHKC
jgi:hypothetical protein